MNPDKKLILPELSLVLMMGASASGKSTFAARHFKETEILSSDYFRALLSDDSNDQTVTPQAFDALKYVASARLKLGRLTVIDATNARPEDRKQFVRLAREFHFMPAVIVMNMPAGVCMDRNDSRSDRHLEEHILRSQLGQVNRSLRSLKREGFRYVYVLHSPEEAEMAAVQREPMRSNRNHESGPFDIIGDIHGCFDETRELLERLGYDVIERDGFSFGRGYEVSHPEGRKPVLLGDLVDRGPQIANVLRLAMSLMETGKGLCIPGNHDNKLVRKLRGKKVQDKFGLAQSVAQLEHETVSFRMAVESFLDSLISHYVLDHGKLVVAHAGMKEELQGRGSAKVRDFALYGETTGETDEFGLPVRLNWAADYRGKSMVVYGHTPVPEPEWLNRTINIDTGCVFGGRLTALRYPEKELVSVAAKEVYVEPIKPFGAPTLTAGSMQTQQAGNASPSQISSTGLNLQQQHDDLLDLRDVSGKMIVSTELGGNITVREQQANAALEAMSRFAVNPKWLIYLPPTMSPSETSQREGFLEFPTEAFEHYALQGVTEVICEEKHMGSRAVFIVCKDKDVALNRFGVKEQKLGICYTRTGRAFFDDPLLESKLLDRLTIAMEKANLWQELHTDWVCLDCELMPWSLKAQELLRSQYAAVGSSATASLAAAHESLLQASQRGMDVSSLMEKINARRMMTNSFVETYQNYCWPIRWVKDITIAPFHIMAAEGQVFHNKSHLWHMDVISKLCAEDPEIFRSTKTLKVNLSDDRQRQEATDWWLEMTDNGGEGMVVKPLNFVFNGSEGLVQPAVKCRGRDFLRINYGPEYTFKENLERLRRRGLALKRSLAAREFALGLEGLNRFVNREPLRCVHQCAFAVLALESQPVDPRL